MENMLGASLCEVRGLFKDLIDKLCGEDWQKWLEAFKLFLRGHPTWAEGMIYIPLEWGQDLGEVSSGFVQSYVNPGWRLPTEKELRRALLKMKPEGFVLWKYYWTSTKHSSGKGFETIRTHDGRGGLGHLSSFHHDDDQQNPHLRLCRPIKLPE